MKTDEKMVYSIAQCSHQGGRKYNEDRTAVFERDGIILLVLGDGLGGHAGGEVASQALVDAMGDSFNKASISQLSDAGTFLTLSINYAHHTVHRRAVSQGLSVDSPKTTCVACLIKDGIAVWAHSGDSRLYLINKREINYVTTDHVSIKPGREHNSPINRCVGGLEAPKPEIGDAYNLEHGDTFFIASDGAWATFEPQDLIDYVDPEHPTLGIDNLLQKLESRNKAPSDNLSVIVLFWGAQQKDDPNFNELNSSSCVQILDSSDNKQGTAETTKFDIKELDSAILEIESFISDIDSKL